MLRNKLRYLVLLAAMGLLSILYNQYVMGMIFLTILIMPSVLFALLCLTYGMVRAEITPMVHVANKEEIIPITVQLSNPTIFPVSNLTIYLKYKNAYSPKHFSKELNVSLDRRTTTNVTCNIQSQYIGNLEISLEGIRFFDYFNLFSLKKRIVRGVKIAILPSLHEMLENDIKKHSSQAVESDYYSSVKSGDDPTEVFAIREYREGDRQQRIHWKLSMKQEQLMIKEFSDPLNCSLLNFVDLRLPEGKEPLLYIDALVESALSISYTFMLGGQIHYLSWYDVKHGSCRRVRIVSEKELFEAVDGLLQSKLISGNMDGFMAYLAEHPNEQYSDLIYVTGKISEDGLNTLAMARANKKRIIHISDIPTTLNEDDNQISMEQIRRDRYHNNAAQMGISLFSVNISDIKGEMERINFY